MAAEELFTCAFSSDEFIDAIAVQPRASNGTPCDSSDKPDSLRVAVSFSALESNQWGGGVVIFDGATGERLCGSRVATGVSALAWTSESADVLAFGCDNGDVQLMKFSSDADYKLEAFGSTSQETRPGHDDVVTGVAASTVEKNIFASCSWDLTVKVWDVDATDKTLTTLDGHSDLIWDITTNPTTPHVWATASQDATVQLWDDRELTQSSASTLSTLSFAALAVDWHPSQSHLLAVGLENGSVLIFDTRAPQSPLNKLTIHEGAIHRVTYSPFQSDLLAVGCDDAQVSIISNGASPQPHIESLTSKAGAVHRDYVRALDWYSLPATGAPEDSSFATPRSILTTGSWDHTVRSWAITNV